MKVICAGQSDAGMAFSARYADFNFCFGKGVNTPTAFAPTAARMKQAAEQTGRDVGSYVLFMVIADETDDAARAKWEHYKAGADEEALSWLTEQSQKDTPLRYRHQRPSDGRSHFGGKHQYGDVSRFLRQCRAHVR